MSDEQTHNISAEEKARLIERVEYLQREAKMLTRVIDHVPYDENPPDKPSIQQLLIHLHRIQSDYLLPLVNKLEQNSESEDVSHPELESFVSNLEDQAGEVSTEIEELLETIARKREQILFTIKELSESKWSLNIDQDRTLKDELDLVVDYETSILSQISEQVMVYSQQRSNQREIEQRQQQRGENSNQQ